MDEQRTTKTGAWETHDASVDHSEEHHNLLIDSNSHPQKQGSSTKSQIQGKVCIAADKQPSGHHDEEASFESSHPLLTRETGDHQHHPHPHELKRNTGLLYLCAVAFLTVGGGPFGMEGAIRTGGPFLTFLSLGILPICWSLTMALMTAELSTAMPHNMGYILWVQRAFGDSMGFLNGLASLFCNIVENSLYPTLFIEYISFMIDEETMTPTFKLVLQIIAILVVFSINILGLDIVGIVSVVFSVLILLPFIIMFFVSLPKIDPIDWFDTIDSPDWSSFYPIVLWNLSGWDNLGCVAGEVSEPHKNYPKGMSITLVMVVASYLVPLVAGIALSEADYESWTDGYFAELAANAGSWLGYWVALTAILSTLGMFNVILATSARALHGMAELNMAPQWIGKLHPKYQTPYMSIIVYCVTILMATIFFDFKALVELDMIYYGWSIILEFSAYFYLKISEPDMPRPYVVPGGLVGGAVLSIPPIILSLCAIWLASWRAKLMSVGGMAGGYVIYRLGTNGTFDYLQERFRSFCTRARECCVHKPQYFQRHQDVDSEHDSEQNHELPSLP